MNLIVEGEGVDVARVLVLWICREESMGWWFVQEVLRGRRVDLDVCYEFGGRMSGLVCQGLYI